MRNFWILISGMLFGVGVTVSGMVNPMKVLNFMDLIGLFDPTLIFVMGTGLVVTLIGYRFVFARGRPFFATQFHVPGKSNIDMRLVGGAALFGLGWGLSGFCPGPAVASLVLGQGQAFLFVATMALGMLATKSWLARRL
jgi:uncharacterized membrane protein YedE/YeeE